MAVERMPITPEVLTWARERAGYSLEELGSIREPADIQAWEQGTAAPTYAEMDALARLFRISSAVFFFPEPPDMPIPPRDFKTLGEDAFHRFNPRLRQLIREAELHQRNCARLRALDWRRERLLVNDLRPSLRDSADSIAMDIRRYLGLLIERQSKWKSAPAQFNKCRSALHSVGVAIYKSQFRLEDYAGFCLYDRKYPVIAVDSRLSWTQQLFTVFHALGHLLFETSGVDGPSNELRLVQDREGARIEALCDELATGVLAPDSLLTQRAELQSATAAAPDVQKLAEMFALDARWMNQKLLKMKLISMDDFHANLLRLPVAPADNQDEPGVSDATCELVGVDYINMAFDSFERDEFDEDDLADYLYIVPRDIDALAASMGRWSQ